VTALRLGGETAQTAPGTAAQSPTAKIRSSVTLRRNSSTIARPSKLTSGPLRAARSGKPATIAHRVRSEVNAAPERRCTTPSTALRPAATSVTTSSTMSTFSRSRLAGTPAARHERGRRQPMTRQAAPEHLAWRRLPPPPSRCPSDRPRQPDRAAYRKCRKRQGQVASQTVRARHRGRGRSPGRVRIGSASRESWRRCWRPSWARGTVPGRSRRS
jgi:hypothetical protein